MPVLQRFLESCPQFADHSEHCLLDPSWPFLFCSLWLRWLSNSFMVHVFFDKHSHMNMRHYGFDWNNWVCTPKSHGWSYSYPLSRARNFGISRDSPARVDCYRYFVLIMSNLPVSISTNLESFILPSYFHGSHIWLTLLHMWFLLCSTIGMDKNGTMIRKDTSDWIYKIPQLQFISSYFICQ